MLDEAVGAIGNQRLLWGSDITMETGLAKLRALENTGLSNAEDLKDIRWRNAARVFGQSVLPKGFKPKAESQKPRAKSQEPKAKSQKPKAQSRPPRAARS